MSADKPPNRPPDAPIRTGVVRTSDSSRRVTSRIGLLGQDTVWSRVNGVNDPARPPAHPRRSALLGELPVATHARAGARRRSDTVTPVSAVQTILVYVLIPAGIYGVIALLTLWPKSARSPRYRPGQQWTYEPVWWSASGLVAPEQTGRTAETEAEAGSEVRTARGGARGNW